MDKAYLTEAFRALDLLNEQDFNLSSQDASDEMKDFLDNDDVSVMEIDVIDPEVTDEEDIQDSYEGKVILDCSVCHSKIYKDSADVVIDEETDYANVDEECPFCFSADGYNIIGQVAPFTSEEDVEVEVDEEPVEDNIEEPVTEDEIEKSLTEAVECKKAKLSSAGPGKWNVLVDEVDGGRISNNSGLKVEADSEEEAKELLSKYGYIVESIEDVTINTEDETITMETKEDGGVAVETTPKEECCEEGEMIAPVEPEIQDEIEMNTAEEKPETFEDEINVPIDEFDEESFDELGESFLKNTYDNVKSYKTESISEKEGNKLFIEGLITFTSGNTKKTSFIFEAKDITKSGRIRFMGENCQISRGKKSFTMSGSVNGKKFISESLNYNYRAKDVNGKSARMYGTVRRNK